MDSDRLAEYILSQNQKQRSEAFTYLYQQCFPNVKGYILKNSGNHEEAKDVFQEAIMVTYRNLLNNKFRWESSIGQYVVGIARNLWLSKLRKKTLPTTALENQSIPVEEDIQEVDINLLKRVMVQLSKGCQAVLKYFYYDGDSMEEVALKLSLGSAQAAKTKKLRCMKKLGDIIQNSGLKSDDFLK